VLITNHQKKLLQIVVNELLILVHFPVKKFLFIFVLTGILEKPTIQLMHFYLSFISTNKSEKQL